MNTILYIIGYSAMAAWLFPPFRQYRTKYFLYFLLLAISDPVSEITSNLWCLSMWEYYIIFSVISVLTLMDIKYKKLYAIAGTVMLTALFSIIEVNNYTAHNVVAFNIFLCVIIIARLFSVNLRETEKIDLFLVVLLLYNISNVIKIIFSVSHGKTGYLYFFLTNIFQIFIAIYFTIYNINNSKKFPLFRDLPGKA